MGFPIYYQGKILFRNGKPAFSTRCCCGGDSFCFRCGNFESRWINIPPMTAESLENLDCFSCSVQTGVTLEMTSDTPPLFDGAQWRTAEWRFICHNIGENQTGYELLSTCLNGFTTYVGKTPGGDIRFVWYRNPDQDPGRFTCEFTGEIVVQTADVRCEDIRAVPA